MAYLSDNYSISAYQITYATPLLINYLYFLQRLSISASLDDMTVLESREVIAGIEEIPDEGDKASVAEKYQGNTYLDYLKTGNALLLFSAFVFFAFCAQFFASATDLWMSQW